MKCISALLLTIALTLLTFSNVNGAIECRKLDDWCDGSVFNPCCDNLHCELTGFADGRCRTCLGLGSLCATHNQCCSRLCTGLKCAQS
ncbi:unnamed protein product [Dicrocoelium dendriticum]|nr:unnamed protein product [Dicrocoelium dendriticum]